MALQHNFIAISSCGAVTVENLKFAAIVCLKKKDEQHTKAINHIVYGYQNQTQTKSYADSAFISPDSSGSVHLTIRLILAVPEEDMAPWTVKGPNSLVV